MSIVKLRTTWRGGRTLPVAWDGVPVTWSDFLLEDAVFICDRTRGTAAAMPTCWGCGYQGLMLTARGTRSRTGPATFRLGRWHDPLIARRCPKCSHDSVHDMGTGETWDLDETDYGPEGSTAP